jgi:hypothetical protein
MKEIKRYAFDSSCEEEPALRGPWVRYSDVEALQKELEDLRAKAIAAVWLMPEDTGIRELQELREEARKVFMGKDKQVIAKLQDELAYAQEAYRHVTRPPPSGVNAVYGVRQGDENRIRYALMITKLHHGSNGGLEIEVQLP